MQKRMPTTENERPVPPSFQKIAHKLVGMNGRGKQLSLFIVGHHLADDECL